MSSANELIQLSATEVVDLLERREVRALDLVDAAIARIEDVDGAVNALPVHMFEAARATARRFEERGSSDASALMGLPIAVKEFNDVKGYPTTYGSPIFKDFVAETNDVVVDTLLDSGAIIVAKSNVPEFAGANTFNPVYGASRNPHDLKFTVGGSSGGAAASLSSGQVWLANGSDLGGSLRIPAAYCGIVGLRPSVGRVSRPAACPAFDPLWVEGPMARSVPDLALMLDAQSRPSLHDALALPRPPVPFVDAARRKTTPSRVAFSADLGLARAVDTETADICARAAQRFGGLGSRVEEACPDLSGSIEAFHTLRALLFAQIRGELLDGHRDRIAPEIVGNIQQGLDLSVKQILDAERLRARIYQAVADFFVDFDLLACPTVACPPYPVEQRYPTEIGGEKLTNYIDWMFLTFCLTITGCPVISIPCGRTSQGLPVGLQLMGRPRGDFELIAAAAALEAELALGFEKPVTPRR